MKKVIFIKSTFVNIFYFVIVSQSLIRQLSAVKKVLQSYIKGLLLHLQSYVKICVPVWISSLEHFLHSSCYIFCQYWEYSRIS